MAFRDDPDFVSGRKGRFQIVPWITHPPFCVCSSCPLHREREATRTGKPIGDVWAAPLDIRLRRISPHPDDRKASRVDAQLLRRDEEQRLVIAVQRADAQRHARQTAIRFGVVVDAYRDYMIREGKDYKRAKSLIDKIEAFIGPDRDTAAVDFAIYQGLLATVAELHAETRRHYASTLLSMLNHAKSVCVIVSHKLEGVRVPQVARDDEPEPWTPKELAVIMGPALKRYEKEQRAWDAKVAQEKKNRGLRSPSYVPLRGFCLIAYYTMMRPANNRHLDWEEITSLDPTLRRGTFKLNRHKNVNKGIKARGCLARELVDYLLSIRPANASGPIHVNPVTGKPYIDFRKQWKRLLEIAGEILGYKLKGKKAKFLNFRHTGASDVAQRGRDASHLLRVVRMMGDTSLATVNRHYFNLDDEAMEEIIDGWEIPDAEVFAADLAPLCEEPEPDESATSSVAA